MAYPATTAARQEPFTMYPNRYVDRIKPTLTDTQRDVADVVIRMTYGWHRTSARISNGTFMLKTNKSEPAVIRAKKELEDMGLLVVLERGGGTTTGLYMLDLYYDTDRSVKAAMRRQEEQVEQSGTQESAPPEDTPTAQEVTELPAPVSIPVDPIAIPESATSELSEQSEPQSEVDIPPQPNEVPEPDVEVQPNIEVSMGESEVPPAPEDSQPIDATPEGMCIDESVQRSEVEVVKLPAGSGAPPDNQDQILPTPQAEISDPTATSESISAEDSANPTPKAGLAPGGDPSSIIYINKTHRGADAASEDIEARNETKDRRKTIVNVCYKLNQWGFKVESRDYGFIGWAIKTYGIEAVEHKLNIMKFQILRGVKFTNPFGWLRMSLTKGYQYSQFDTQRMKAEECARLAAERSRRKLEKWSRHCKLVAAEQEDPEAMARVVAAQAAFWATIGEEND